MCEGGGSEPGGDGAVTLDTGDALEVLAYNISGGRRARGLQRPARRWRHSNAGSWSTGIQHTCRKAWVRVAAARPAVTEL